MSKPQPPNSPGDPDRSNAKRMGERSEAAFLYQATQRRFAVCKPWGDSERYDFILDNRPRPTVHLFRIQVKCTESLRVGGYETHATYHSGSELAVYTKRDIDFIAAHIVSLNVWYIVPVEVCMSRPVLRFYPHRKAGRRMWFERYREAWYLLDPPLLNPPFTIHACIDPDYPEGYEPEDCDPEPHDPDEELPESK
jgi:hypothetical protein